MRKWIPFIVLLTIPFSAFGQFTAPQFTPKWKVGEKKIVVAEQHETEYKADKLVEDTTQYLEYEITVVKENRDNYILAVRFENVALRSAMILFDKLGEKLKRFEKIELQCQVDKLSGKAELLNWKAASKFMLESMRQMSTLIHKKAPDMSPFVNLAFTPIKVAFSNKVSIESYFNTEIGYMFFPFGKNFSANDTVRIVEECENPFQPSDTMLMTTLAYISNDNPLRKTCDINTVEVYDLDGFRIMMSAMMKKMFSNFAQNDSSTDRKEMEFNDIEFDIQKKTVIAFNYTTTWPLRVDKTVKVIVKDPTKKTEKFVVTTITIR